MPQHLTRNSASNGTLLHKTVYAWVSDNRTTQESQHVSV